jgi:hypothetical protein
LETEVCDSDDVDFILKTIEHADQYDQSLIGKGSRPSGKYIENLLSKLNFTYELIADNRCNASFHQYDWTIKNTNTWKDGLRRFWFCKKGDTAHD